MGFFNFSKDIAIDLGTANTIIYVKGRDVVLNQPSIVAIDKENNKIVAVGADAKEMLGKTPKNISVIRPLQDGVIADFKITEKMLRYFIFQVMKHRYLLKPKMVICVPSGITEVEQKAVKDSAMRAGARDVYLVSEPIAAAIGVGLTVSEPSGNMIVDIGGGTTEIAVIALNSIVCENSIRTAGDEFEQAILGMMRKKYNLLIGELTAEHIKHEIGSVFPLKEELTIEVSGRDLVTGIPKTVNVSSVEVREAMTEVVGDIVNAVKKALEETPPQFSNDLVRKGLVLSGGGALIRGLDELLISETNLPVSVVENPLLSVARGVGKILDNLNKYKDVLIK
jgi:rod shape-determining protein MreB